MSVSLHCEHPVVVMLLLLGERRRRIGTRIERTPRLDKLRRSHVCSEFGRLRRLLCLLGTVLLVVLVIPADAKVDVVHLRQELVDVGAQSRFASHSLASGRRGHAESSVWPFGRSDRRRSWVTRSVALVRVARRGESRTGSLRSVVRSRGCEVVVLPRRRVGKRPAGRRLRKRTRGRRESRPGRDDRRNGCGRPRCRARRVIGSRFVVER